MALYLSEEEPSMETSVNKSDEDTPNKTQSLVENRLGVDTVEGPVESTSSVDHHYTDDKRSSNRKRKLAPTCGSGLLCSVQFCGISFPDEVSLDIHHQGHLAQVFLKSKYAI